MWKILCAGSAGRQLKLRNTSSSIVLPCAEEKLVCGSCPGGGKTENVDIPEDYCEYDDIFYLKHHFCDCRKYVICEPGKPPQVIECPQGRRFRYFRKNFVLYKLGHNFCTEGSCN
nr:unnamed protein product [Callosobruchus chinensis]